MISEKKSFLSFNLESETFAINVIKVLEVLQMQKITSIPKTPDYIKGVLNFRGEIIPVINTRLKFNLTKEEDLSKHVIIVLDFERDNKQQKVGAIVDSVMDVFEYNEIDIKDVPELGSRYNLEFIYGMIKKGENFITILDVDKVFSVEELSIVKDIIKNTELEDESDEKLDD